MGIGSAKYVVIDARSKGRIFNIQKQGNLKLINVTIKNGFVSKNYNYGGAIYSKGVLSVNNCIFSNNRAKAKYSCGGAICTEGSAFLKNSVFEKCIASYGGAIYIEGSVNIKRSVFEKCIANQEGGAIWSEGSVNLKNSFFEKCVANKGGGGAIYNEGSLKLKSSVFENCSADDGGAIFCAPKYMTHVFNCKFINNRGYFGSAISNSEYFYGNIRMGSKIIVKGSNFKNCGIENGIDYSQITQNKFDMSSYNAISNYGEKVIISYNKILGREYYDEEYVYNGDYYGIDLYLANYNNVHHNKISGFFDVGIYIVGIKNKVKNNQFLGKNKGIGIYLNRVYSKDLKELDISKYNLITKNTVIKFKYGILVYKGLKTNKISFNKFINNKIALTSSYKFKNKSNIFKGNNKNIIKINRKKVFL